MDYEQLKALVKEMRSAQKEYFRDRSHDALQRSKALEKRVDEIKPFVFGESETPQIRKRLFFDVFPNEDKTLWFEAKVEMITIDGDRETRKAVKFIIQEDSIHQALKELKFKLSGYDCDIISIAQSPVLDILRPEKGE